LFPQFALFCQNRYDDYTWAETATVCSSGTCVQTALTALGWTETLWNGGVLGPASEDKDWADLTTNEAAAAEFLCFDERDWDGMPLDDRGGDVCCGFGPKGCFSGDMLVEVQDKGTMRMASLQVGDHVLLDNDATYSTVYAFGHRNPTKIDEFVQIYTKNCQNPLEITKEHLVYLGGEANPVPAGSVKVGDFLTDSQDDEVTDIQYIQKEGVYAPLTVEGTLMVNNGIKVSSYVSLIKQQEHTAAIMPTTSLLSQHEVVHMMLSPFRMVCLGVSSSLCNKYNRDGMPYYVSFGIQLTQWVQDQHEVVGSLVMVMIFLLTGVCRMVELVMGPALGAIVILSSLVALFYYRIVRRTMPQKQ